MDPRRSSAVMLGLVALGWLAACAGPPGDEAGTAGPRPAAGTPADLARAAVAAQLNLGVDDVRVISVEARDFPDSSLDCPEPDMSYLQVITPGYQVITEADGRRFDVRVAGSNARICRRRKPAASGARPRATSAQALADRARADLARRLQAGHASISVSAIRALRAGDDLPGCTLECASDLCGYAVTLGYAGRSYAYYASDARLEPCPPILPG